MGADGAGLIAVMTTASLRDTPLHRPSYELCNTYCKSRLVPESRQRCFQPLAHFSTRPLSSPNAEHRRHPEAGAIEEGDPAVRLHPVWSVGKTCETARKRVRPQDPSLSLLPRIDQAPVAGDKAPSNSGSTVERAAPSAAERAPSSSAELSARRSATMTTS